MQLYTQPYWQRVSLLLASILLFALYYLTGEETSSPNEIEQVHRVDLRGHDTILFRQTLP